MTEKGHVVLRFWEEEVFKKPQLCVRKIMKAQGKSANERVSETALEEKVLEILREESTGLSADLIFEHLLKKYPREKCLEGKMRATLRKLESEGLANSKRTHYFRSWRAARIGE